MKRFMVDLHIHTALSPCASDEMTPTAIVLAAVHKGLAMIAICDHNSAGNASASQEAGRGALAVLAGVEITTSEEVHVLGLFADAAAACAASRRVLDTLPEARGGSRNLDRQSLLDAAGRTVGTEPKLLAAASAFGLSETVGLIKSHDGLAVAAHVNRPAFSVLSQLGMFPLDVEFDAVEVSAGRLEADVPERLPAIASSDSHFLADVGTTTTALEMLEPTFHELRLALKGIAGRRVCDV